MFLLHWNRSLLCETWLFTTVGYIWRKPVLTYAISVVIYWCWWQWWVNLLRALHWMEAALSISCMQLAARVATGGPRDSVCRPTASDWLLLARRSSSSSSSSRAVTARHSNSSVSRQGAPWSLSARVYTPWSARVYKDTSLLPDTSRNCLTVADVVTLAAWSGKTELSWSWRRSADTGTTRTAGRSPRNRYLSRSN